MPDVLQRWLYKIKLFIVNLLCFILYELVHVKNICVYFP